MNQAEEDLIVLSAQAGNERAFALLFRRHHAALVRFAARMSRDPQLAQEAVQEAWIRIAGRIRRLEDPRAFRSWLFRAVRWQVLDLLKRPRYPEESLVEEAVESPAETAPESPDGYPELVARIADLPAIERQSLHLFYLDEMKISEIAVVLDIPPGTVKSRLNRARNRLRELTDNGEPQ